MSDPELQPPEEEQPAEQGAEEPAEGAEEGAEAPAEGAEEGAEEPAEGAEEGAEEPTKEAAEQPTALESQKAKFKDGVQARIRCIISPDSDPIEEIRTLFPGGEPISITIPGTGTIKMSAAFLSPEPSEEGDLEDSGKPQPQGACTCSNTSDREAAVVSKTLMQIVPLRKMLARIRKKVEVLSTTLGGGQPPRVNCAPWYGKNAAPPPQQLPICSEPPGGFGCGQPELPCVVEQEVRRSTATPEPEPGPCMRKVLSLPDAGVYVSVVPKKRDTGLQPDARCHRPSDTRSYQADARSYQSDARSYQTDASSYQSDARSHPDTRSSRHSESRGEPDNVSSGGQADDHHSSKGREKRHHRHRHHKHHNHSCGVQTNEESQRPYDTPRESQLKGHDPPLVSKSYDPPLESQRHRQQSYDPPRESQRHRQQSYDPPRESQRPGQESCYHPPRESLRHDQQSYDPRGSQRQGQQCSCYDPRESQRQDPRESQRQGQQRQDPRESQRQGQQRKDPRESQRQGQQCCYDPPRESQRQGQQSYDPRESQRQGQQSYDRRESQRQGQQCCYDPPRESQRQGQQSYDPRESQRQGQQCCYDPPRESQRQGQQSYDRRESQRQGQQCCYDPPRESQRQGQQSCYDPPRESQRQGQQCCYDPPRESQRQGQQSCYDPPRESQRQGQQCCYDPPRESQRQGQQSYDPRESQRQGQQSCQSQSGGPKYSEALDRQGRCPDAVITTPNFTTGPYMAAPNEPMYSNDPPPINKKRGPPYVTQVDMNTWIPTPCSQCAERNEAEADRNMYNNRYAMKYGTGIDVYDNPNPAPCCVPMTMDRCTPCMATLPQNEKCSPCMYKKQPS